MLEFNESEFMMETEVPHEEVIISRTDLKGNITYANDIFLEISGYELDELLGQPHNVVRHPDMPKSVFAEMWTKLKTESKWEGIVKNLRKDKGYYWVYANISGVFKDDILVEYKSIRTPISFEEKLRAQKNYDEIRNRDGDNIRKVVYN
ncbi:MAG: PAS domain-containing protein [Epsilonproteobacteria bacterium]|nr:PAS domain-containing protein [Campylobacterota bacterium]